MRYHYLVILFILFSSLTVGAGSVMAGAGDWEEAHSFSGAVTYVNDTLPANFENFTKAHDFDGVLKYNYDLEGNGTTTESGMDIYEFLVVVVILWIPALCLNYFLPGYGLVVGMIVTSFIMLNVYSSLLVVFFVLIVGSIAIFWKGAEG